jgi:predicted AlkP superfamily phosphohydrolase/phosphomutase
MSMDGAALAQGRKPDGKAAPVIVIGLDAMDCDTALGFAAEGDMPVLAELLSRSGRCSLLLSPGLFVNAIWPNFATGLRPDRHHFHCWDEVDVATYRRQLTSPERIRGTPFWRRLAASGYTTAGIDVPHTVLRNCAGDPHTSLEIAEWGCHDRHLGLQIWPPAERERVLAEFGMHPVFGMKADDPCHFAPDDRLCRAGARRVPDEMKQLTELLLATMPLKTRLLRKYLAARPWDLFVAIYGEAHSAGHQLWHAHDTTHAWFDPAVQRAIGGDPIRRIYAALDKELGELLESVDERATLLVLLSHGMTAHNCGNHLLEEVLRRIELADRRQAGELGWRDGAMRLQAMADSAARAALSLVRPVAAREFASASERARRRFFLEPNNTVVGGVRLNRIGREPRGRVSAGAAEAILTSLERDLLALVNAKTGRPAILAVHRTERWYRRDDSDTMPDLLFDWNAEALIESVRSPKIGLVEVPYDNWRSGDHRARSLMLAMGPGIEGGIDLPAMAMEDVPASLLARFGEDVSDLDGRPADWLAAQHVMA